jgi:superfamily I DNA/RNA helicase
VNLTDEQNAITRFTRESNESLIIEALAGTGKTASLIEILKTLPQASALILAFNKRIADEMARRMPALPRSRMVHVKTLHAAGLWITKHHFPKLVVDKDCSEKLVNGACEKGTTMRARGAALKLLRLVKDFQFEPELDADFAFYTGSDFALFDKLESGPEIEKTIDITRRAYVASTRIAEREGIDFCDMGWLPLVLDLAPPSRYKAVLLDEAQDVSANQLAMVERLLAPGGRIIACGDLNQCIYQWRGAIGTEVWERLRDQYNATNLPLTTTWRCDRAIVAAAHQLVPDLKARGDAGEGLVSHVTEPAFYLSLEAVEGSTFVLSRTNAELLRVALEMWRRNVPFNIMQSIDMLAPLRGVLRKLLKRDVREPSREAVPTLDDETIDEALGRFHQQRQIGEQAAAKARQLTDQPQPDVRLFVDFRQSLAAWYMTEMMKATAAGSAMWAERIDEQHRMLLYCLNYVRHPAEIDGLLDGIYTQDDTCDITLSTVHKAKGMESENVFLLRETFARYQNRRDRDGNPLAIPVEEENILYVGITRAKHSLTWVHLEQ